MPEEPVPAQNLSIVLSGAISLGAYHAGAVAQLGHFIAFWNHRLAERRAEGKDTAVPYIFVDVVSAASAGAMTGAVLTKFVATGSSVQDADEFVQANYKTWCLDELRFTNLLKPSNTKDCSYFSNTVVDRLAESLLLHEKRPVRLQHGQKRLLYTCTMTSLSPIPFFINLDQVGVDPNDEEKKFVGTTRRDWITFRFFEEGTFHLKYNEPETTGSPRFVFDELASQDGTKTEGQMWERFGWAAMTSGAFPIAWQPVRYPRFLRFYPQPFQRLNDNARHTTTMGYTDGGLINNMPLDRATKVLRDSVRFANDPSDLYSNRTYVLVECNPVVPRPMAASHQVESPQRATDLTVGAIGRQLFGAMREQSFYLDLKAAATINKRLSNREQFLWPKLLGQARDTPAESRQVEIDRFVGTISDMLPRRKFEPTPDEFRKVYRSREHLRHFLDDERVDDELLRELFIVLAILADVLADLHDKHPLTLMRIRPEGRLYGQMLEDFGGFLNPLYQQMDFAQGVEDAQVSLRAFAVSLGCEAFLNETAQNPGAGCLLDAESFRPKKDVRPSPDEQDFSQVPLASKRVFYNALFRRLGPWAGSNFGPVPGRLLGIGSWAARVFLKKGVFGLVQNILALVGFVAFAFVAVLVFALSSESLRPATLGFLVGVGSSVGIGCLVGFWVAGRSK